MALSVLLWAHVTPKWFCRLGLPVPSSLDWLTRILRLSAFNPHQPIGTSASNQLFLPTHFLPTNPHIQPTHFNYFYFYFCFNFFNIKSNIYFYFYFLTKLPLLKKKGFKKKWSPFVKKEGFHASFVIFFLPPFKVYTCIGLKLGFMVLDMKGEASYYLWILFLDLMVFLENWHYIQDVYLFESIWFKNQNLNLWWAL